ncbi:hypothetical protein AB0L00_31935 [Actinoallomurus sp. NPDC052308]|uniref:hypothetical protein n=1 Tax=Actinoallomurus sp. NPDC052308 TaxID=3155530 RepID=UPI003444DF8B
MTASHDAAPLMSMTEIAELAGVQRPVVSNWRRRHKSFPEPVEDQARPLFDSRQILDWLVDTRRVERSKVEGDLRLYTLGRLSDQMPPRTLVASLTALICLRHLTGDDPLDDGTPGLTLRLRERARDVDPEDRLLLSEVMDLQVRRLPGIVDELVEAAWGTWGAFERVMEVRDRLSASELSVDRLDPALVRLVCRLTDAIQQADRDGTARIIDFNAGPGDLLLAVADALRDDQEAQVTACCPDPYVARLIRRRLTVRDLQEDGFDVRSDPAGALEGANVIIGQYPYRPGEDRSPGEMIETLNDISLRLVPGATAVILAPVDTIGGLDPADEAGMIRSELLASGAVKAVIRLPGGLVPYRPGYEVALWVLGIDYDSPLRGRVLLADVSDRELTADVIEGLAMDVLTWRQEGFDPDAHSRTYAVSTLIRDVVRSPLPLTPRYLPAEHEFATEIPERVARALELERVLRETRPDRPALHSDLATRRNPTPPRTATIGQLVQGARNRTNRLSLRKGTRVSSALIGPDDGPASRASSYTVIGSPEVLGRSTVGSRRVDRIAFESAYPNAQRSLPGDVIITDAPEPAVLVDHDGYAVIEFPARILRLTERGKEQFTPRVLAALLARSGRVDGAVRPVQRLEEVRLPLLGADELARFDRLLRELDERHRLARKEIDALDELRRIATSGLSDGTLTLADPGRRS